MVVHLYVSKTFVLKQENFLMKFSTLIFFLSISIIETAIGNAMSEKAIIEKTEDLVPFVDDSFKKFQTDLDAFINEAKKEVASLVNLASNKPNPKNLAEMVLINNPEFATKFNIRAEMTDEQVAKQLDWAIIKTRLGNGVVGGVVGAGILF